MLALRTPARQNPRRQRVDQDAVIPAPVEGWDAKSPLASMEPMRAVQLKNWFPQPGYVEVRKGQRYHAWDLGSNCKTVSSINTGTDTFTSNSHGFVDGTAVKLAAATTMPGGTSTTQTYYVRDSATNTFKLANTVGGTAVDVTSSGSGTITVYQLSEPSVETLALWNGPTSSKMFAAAGQALWDVTANAAATLSYSTSLTNDRWQWCNHTTSGGAYLYMVNGTDSPIHFNGTTWAVPTITGITASDAIGVVTHKKRIWFTLDNSTKGAYLGIEAIQGAATTFQFGSLFTRGGKLMAIATWTRDGGSGPDDYLVAISDRGQVAIYSGVDPASDWAIVGVFDVPPPIGRRCFTRYGADLLLLTVQGLFPLSQLIARDQSQAPRVAVSDMIVNAFTTAALSYGSNFGWETVVYPKGTRLLINVPTSETETAAQYVMNTLTGAWCEFDSHNANTWAVFNDLLYYGAGGGGVYRADTGRADLGQSIVAVGQTAYQAHGSANTKLFKMMRPLVTASATNRPSLGISTDFQETQTLSTVSAAAGAAGATWDSSSSRWDSASWGGEEINISDWSDAAAIGTFASLKFRAQTGIQAGDSGWVISRWGTSRWGSDAALAETMRIQGFVLLYEAGAYL